MTDVFTLGLHVGHDRSATLVKNGTLYSHIAQDRLDRVKHSTSHRIPFDAANALLADARLKAGDLAAVGISSCNVVVDSFTEELKDEFCDQYRLATIPFFSCSHHYAHALAAWGTSDFEEALLLVADGAGDLVDSRFEAESLFLAERDGVRILEKRYQSTRPDMTGLPELFNYALMTEALKSEPISLGQKYEQFTRIIGFGANEDGKTMGLAAYGNSLINVRDYQFKSFDFILFYEDLLDKIYNIKIESRLGTRQFIRNHRADLAATAQAFIEHALGGLIDYAADTYRQDHLCLSGGVFLNCVANHKLLEKRRFKATHILPSAGDDGQSIGAAFHATLCIDEPLRRTSAVLPYLGPKPSRSKARQTLSSFGLRFKALSDASLARAVAKELADGRIVAVCRGRAELGPRALCHRSILADPRRKGMKRTLNARVKFREAFRPYAPVVLEEDQMEIFKLEQDSPFMLLAPKVKRRYRHLIPAVTHADATARVQAIANHREPFMHRLLREFQNVTGVPVLLNTSFNLAGQPMVERAHEAVATFLSTDIDILILENYLIDKRDQQQTQSE